MVHRVVGAKAGMALKVLNVREPLGNQLAAELGVRATPTSLLYGAEGKLLESFPGALAEDELTELLAGHGL